MTRAAALSRRSTKPVEPHADEESLYYETNAAVYGSVFATFYDVIAFPLRRMRRRVVQLSGLIPGMHVLDVATGTGAQARAFADAGAHVVGLDLSPRMLAIARRKNRGRDTQFIEGDATALPMADDTFDLATMSFALHEMPTAVRSRAVRELARVTRHGGTIVIVDHAAPRNRIWRAIVVGAWSLVERDAYPEFIRSDLRALLARHGIAVHRAHHAFLGTIQISVGIRI